MTEAIDWGLAVSTATRLAPRGPQVPREEAADAVAMLRDLAQQAVDPVRDVTGLIAPVDDNAQVVDRQAWIASNASSLRLVMGPLMEKAEDAPSLVRGIGGKGTAVQIGAVLGWLSGKVLGQYEVFTEAQPRLLLVAPTIVHVEQQLAVPPRDFRMWVCLHEETHRVQFGAVPWLADHLLALITEFVEASDIGLRQMLRSLAAAVSSLARSATGSDTSVMEAVQTPEQRAIFDRITALMSLLEGHADVVMDDVGPGIVPSVAMIRERFTQRRASPSAIDAIARRALGLDVKLRQYSEGAAFVRHAIDAVGMTGFNRVWSSAESLPTRAEIRDPQRWVERMGSPAEASA